MIDNVNLTEMGMILIIIFGIPTAVAIIKDNFMVEFPLFLVTLLLAFFGSFMVILAIIRSEQDKEEDKR